ncbi:MAG TPA: ubiquinol-cytochrome C chaperone family protein [Xanthobacteraceae bacterium]|jgi:cytochrome b pre-mRNA-processing protein 3|nr:ubiquinol-cytochrome C chaperone family protein [Xanthobacteraceae bacterium]
MIFRLFQRNRQDATIRALYGAIVAQARQAVFYAEYDVPDTVEGRLDMIMLHISLFFARVRTDRLTRALGQGVFDLFCQDVDHNFREMGIGDLAVPKRMQRVAEAFYGRAAAYDAALETSEDELLTAALARNIFAHTQQPQGAPRLASYVRKAVEHLANQAGQDFARGILTFPNPHTISVTISPPRTV